MGVGASGVAAGSGLSLPGRGGQSNNSNRKKVVLEPGHSPLDWARLQRSGIDLRVCFPQCKSIVGGVGMTASYKTRLTGRFCVYRDSHTQT